MWALESFTPHAECSSVNEVIVFLSNPHSKESTLRLGEKIQILIWICRLSTSLIRLPLFYCLFKWRLAPSIIVMRSARQRGPAQNKNMHQQSWCGGRAACNKFHACAKESYYIARRVPQDLTKSQGLAFKIFTFFLLCAYKQGFCTTAREWRTGLNIEQSFKPGRVVQLLLLGENVLLALYAFLVAKPAENVFQARAFANLHRALSRLN